MRRADRIRWIVVPFVLAAVFSVIGQQPAFAGPPRWTPPVPTEVGGVKVVDMAPANARKLTASTARPVRAAWPAAATTTTDLSASSAGAIRLSAAETDDKARSLHAVDAAPSKVSVTVHDRAATDRAHVAGVLFSVARADGGTRPTRATLQVDYSAFADAYGGDWASRLRLVQLPACALTTPDAAACQGTTPLDTVNDAGRGTLTAVVPMAASQATVLAADAPATGSNGDYTATSLSAAGTWQVSPQTGDFSWSESVRLPSIPGADAPQIGLGYSAGSIDGRTGATNNQASWVGDGWDYSPGFIERKYDSCADDNPGHKTGDNCWFDDNATLSLSGHAGELIRNGSVWKLKNDDGTKVERVAGDGSRANGDNDNEYWKVTTTDGTQYFFGYHRLPGWVGGNAETNSVWTVPVYGNNAGEPCYNATFGNAWCNQGWRWNLDYVVNPNGYTSMYYYGKEAGAYGRDNNVNQRTAYTRSGYLDHIDYGMRSGTEYSAAAPARVSFGTAERCLASCWSGAAWTSTPTTANWKDTPWDLDCTAAPCKTTQTSPTFWSARRLTTITTQLRDGTASYRDVESWTLRHEFPSAGSNEGTPMWLAGITHAGLVTTAGGTAVTDPEVTFDHGAEPLPNRVDGPADGRTALNRWRIKSINNESGGQIIVTYSPVSDCVRGSTPNPETNTTRCMPAYYASPNTGDPTLDWFHKYVVTRIDLDDLATDEPTQTTYYDYPEGAAWHYNDDAMTKAKYRTWGDWRGYGRVVVRQGTAAVQHSAVEHRYLRGMDGDHLGSGTRHVTVGDSWGGTWTDHEALQGFELQEIVLNGPDGAEVTSTLNEPWKNGPTATRTVGGVTTNAWQVQVGSTRTRTVLPGGAVQVSKVANTYNSEGLVTAVEDSGDEAVTGDETCQRTTYARNDGTWLIDSVSQQELISGTCATAATPTTVLKRSRAFYDSYTDDSSWGLAPTAGNVVRQEQLSGWNGSTPLYLPVSRMKYDNGRVVESRDAAGNLTATAYATANGGQVTQVTVTNALGQTTTSTKEPAWNLDTHVVDPNGIVTDLAYDGLGRLTGAWLPGRAKATQTPTRRYTYTTRNTGGPTAVTTETLVPSGAYEKSVDIYDGFLRVRQHQAQATGGGRVLNDTVYGTNGQVAWSSEPYHDTTNAAVSTALGIPQGQIPSITEHTYDGAGRDVQTTFKADGVAKWGATTSYTGSRTSTTPPPGGTATTRITDIRNNVTELRQYKNPADVGSDDPAKFDRTTYAYDLNGRLKTVTDAMGNTWTRTYDPLGRITKSTDPDRGTVTSTYTSTGKTETQTVQLGTGTATTAYTYDALDRRLTIRDDSITGTVRAAWTYDTLTNGIGKLTSSTRYVNGSAYTTQTDSFDAVGRPTSTSVVLPATESRLCVSDAAHPCTYTVTASYRADDSLYQITQPTVADLPSEKLSLGYDDIGQQTTMLSASQIYVYSATFDKTGRLTQRQLGAFGSRVAVTSTYDGPTSRLSGTNVVPEGKAEAANYQYAYDAAGNVTGVSDAPAGQTADNQCFGYDHQRRLTEAWTPVSGDCQAAPTTAGLGGPAPYWQSWQFDAAGNRTKQVQHAAAGNTTTDYAYPAAGAARPHAVGTVTASGAATWTHAYTYDNGGNAKTRTTPAGAQQTLTFDREGMLSTVVEGGKTTQYLYDANGNRLIAIDGNDRTLYLGNSEVHYNAATSVTAGTRYYVHNEQTVAVRSVAGLQWIVGDQHGTAQLTVDSVSLTVAKQRTTPYGETRGATGPTWPAALDRGFVGGVADPTGLTHLGVREYDPAIGRFVSADSTSVFDDPQQLGSYGYASNNPVTGEDPSGMCWSWMSWLCSAGNAVVSGVKAVGSGIMGGLRAFGSGAVKWWNSVWQGAVNAYKAADKWVRDNYNKAKDWTDEQAKKAKPKIKAAWDKTVKNTKHGLSKAWQTTRLALNAPLTLVAIQYAEAGGGRCSFESSQMMFVCRDTTPWMYFRGGTTFGSTYITGKKQVTDERLAHEAKHADQYAIFGAGGMAILYPLDEGLSGGGKCNHFERWAGLHGGGYDPATGCNF